MEKIKINGKEWAIKYNMGVVLDWEREKGEGFSLDTSLLTNEARLLLCYVALKRANKEEMKGTSFDQWAESLTFADSLEIEKVLAELIREFYRLPATEPEEVSGEGDDEGGSKNA